MFIVCSRVRWTARVTGIEPPDAGTISRRAPDVESLVNFRPVDNGAKLSFVHLAGGWIIF
jgi:hypothetical protein